MITEESEINRIRFEDLAPSLQTMINNIISYNDTSYKNLRNKISELSSKIDVSTVVYAGIEDPKEISVGKTVYFDTKENTVKLADSNGDWIYLN